MRYRFLCVWLFVSGLLGCGSGLKLPWPSVTDDAAVANEAWSSEPSPLGLFNKKAFSLAYSRCDDLIRLRAKHPRSKYYNWSPSAPCGDYNAFVSMVYSPRASLEAVKETLQRQSVENRWVLGPNECDLPEQCNAAAQPVAQLWKRMEDELRPLSAKLIFPVASQYHPDFIWDTVCAFQSRYGRLPVIDAFAIHAYFPQEKLKQYLQGEISKIDTRFNRAYAGKPIWVTEFGPECWKGGAPDRHVSLMKNVTAWLETHPRVQHYFWFTSRIYGNEPWGTNWQSCSMISGMSDRLTELGRTYGGLERLQYNNDHGTSPLPNGDPRFLWWDDTHFYCPKTTP